jgi:hypothetical protein
VGVIVTCSRAACDLSTDMPDADWLAVRPLVWTANTQDVVYCSPRCMVLDTTERYAPPRGLGL